MEEADAKGDGREYREKESSSDEVLAVPLSAQERELSAPDDDDDELVSSSAPQAERRKSKVGAVLKKTFSKSGTPSGGGGGGGGLFKSLSKSLSGARLSRAGSSGTNIAQDTATASGGGGGGGGGASGASKGGEVIRQSMMIRLNARQTAKSYNAPALINAPYGVRDSVDLLSLFHNGARAELANAFHMVALMERFGRRNTHDLIAQFWAYFEVIWDYVEDYFDIQESVMFACLEEKRLIPFPELTESARRMNKLAIVLKGSELKKQVQWYFSELSVAEAQDVLRSAVTEAAVALSEYFLLSERLLPGYIESVLDADAIVELERSMLAALIAKGKRPWANAHIAVRWQSDPKLYQSSVSRHFSGKRMLEFKRFQRVFESEHQQILKSFNELGRTLPNNA